MTHKHGSLYIIMKELYIVLYRELVEAIKEVQEGNFQPERERERRDDKGPQK
jgi:hypothetical protein